MEPTPLPPTPDSPAMVTAGGPQIFTFFDTETWNLPASYGDYRHPGGPKLAEIAWLRMDSEGRIFRAVSQRIIPWSTWVCDHKAVEIHGITRQMAEETGVELDSVITDIESDFNSSHCIVAHNLNFDALVYRHAAHLLDRRPVIWPLTECTMLSTTPLCRIPKANGKGIKWPKLQELHLYLFGETFDGAHGAFADICATARCFFKYKFNLNIDVQDLLDHLIANTVIKPS